MKWSRVLARATAEAVDLASVGRQRRGLRVLLYHAVGTRLTHDRYGISVAPRVFDAQMRALLESPGVELVSFQLAALRGGERRIAITFDDGYRDNLRIVAPLLASLGIPFTVFVTSSFIGSAPEYLTAAELSELAAIPGVTIGAHGATHRSLAGCDDATLHEELRASRCRLEDIVHRPVLTMAYPNGSTDRRVRDAAQRAGYAMGGTSRFGINDARADPLLLARCEIVATDSARVFRQKLSGAWDWYGWRALKRV